MANWSPESDQAEAVEMRERNLYNHTHMRK